MNALMWMLCGVALAHGPDAEAEPIETVEVAAPVEGEAPAAEVPAARGEDDAPVGEADGEETELDEEPFEGPWRDQPPEVGIATPFDYPEMEERELSPGVRLLHVQVPRVRKVSVRLVVHRGAEDLGGAFSAEVRGLEGLLDVAGGDYDSVALETARDLHNVDLSSWMGYTRGGLDMDVPREDLDRGIELLTATLRQPSFPGKELRRWITDRTVYMEQQAITSPRVLARYAATYGWYPADSVYGTRVGAADYELVTRTALQGLYRDWLDGAAVTVLVVGDLSADEAATVIAPVVEGLGGAAAESPEQPHVPSPGERVIAVGLPGQEQVTIGVRALAPVASDPDRVAMEVMNFALGGTFLARLNRNLREENGFTYGIYASVDSRPERGVWSTATRVATGDTAEAILEIEREIAGMAADGVTEGELDAAIREQVATWNSVQATADSAARFFEERAFRYQESVAAARARLDAMGAVTAEDTARVAEAYLGLGRPRLWVLVGDPAGLRAELAELGWSDVEWVNAEAALAGAY